MLVAAGLLVSCNNKKNDPGANNSNREKDDYLGSDTKEKEKGEPDSKNTDFTSSGSNWSSADVEKLNLQCEETFKDDPEKGRLICPCLTEKFRKQYSSYADMDAHTSYDEGKKFGTQCREEVLGNNNTNTNANTNAGNGWPQSERDGFISSCVTNAMKKGQSRSVSQSYCDCMLNKMEALYPNINDAALLSEAEVDRIIARYKDGCLEEH